VTSADEGGGLIYAIDRSSQKLVVVDPKTNAVTVAIPLAASPDYVRYVSTNAEVWVTQPDKEQIEVFSVGDSAKAPKSSTIISVPGGPESLIIDHIRKRAYTHLWKGETVAISLETRKVVAKWANGCSASRGIALDERRGLLFSGCGEGKAVVVDVSTGKEVSHLTVGPGVDVIDFNDELQHLYVPSARSAELAILGVNRRGGLKLLGKEKTALGAHCVTADSMGQAYVCLPHTGAILVVRDLWPRAQ